MRTATRNETMSHAQRAFSKRLTVLLAFYNEAGEVGENGEYRYTAGQYKKLTFRYLRAVHDTARRAKRKSKRRFKHLYQGGLSDG